MRIEILRSVLISGEPAEAGSFVEVGDSDARLLIGIGAAAEAAEVNEEPEAPKRGRKAAAATETAPEEA